MIFKSEPHYYFHMFTNISFIEPAMLLFYMYYVSGSKLGDGDIKVNETWTLALNIFKSGKRDR